MAAIARRKNTYKLDGGAEIVYGPLSFDELEAYGERRDNTNKKITAYRKEHKTGTLPKDIVAEMQDNCFYAVCCGINNAIPEVIALQDKLEFEVITQEEFDIQVKPFAVTAKFMRRRLDDKLCADLLMEVLRFTGLNIPTKAELEKMQKTMNEGEEANEQGGAKASS